MIRYALNCDNGHEFESWFANSGAYDKQRKRALVTCPVCNSAKVDKAIMAPRLAQSSDESAAPPLPLPNTQMPSPVPAPVPSKAPMTMMSAPERELRQKLKELREHITKNSNYVGTKFPEEARKIHYGESEQRSIYGEASPAEAKELHDEGVGFLPLPILPDDQN